MQLLFEYFPTLAGLIVGLLLIFWPPPKQPVGKEARRRRLAQLDAGAPERFFEERRELETYGPGSAGPYRLWGVWLVSLSVALLLT